MVMACIIAMQVTNYFFRYVAEISQLSEKFKENCTVPYVPPIRELLGMVLVSPIRFTPQILILHVGLGTSHHHLHLRHHILTKFHVKSRIW